MAVGDIYQVVIDQTLHGQSILNVLHFKQDASAAAPETALSTACRTKFIGLLKGVQSTELTHNHLLVQRISPRPPLVPVVDALGAGAGTVAGGSLPTSVTVNITKVTEFAGAGWRGRVYVGGVPVSSESDSKLAAGVQGAWQTLGNTMFNPASWADVSFKPVLWNRTAMIATPTQSGKVQMVLRNQRRRQHGKGV